MKLLLGIVVVIVVVALCVGCGVAVRQLVEKAFGTRRLDDDEDS